MQNKIAEWLANGDTGLSSEVMAYYLGFGVRKKVCHHPQDFFDFMRCLHLVKLVPELREKLPLLGDLSNEWRAIVEAWYELENSNTKEINWFLMDL